MSRTADFDIFFNIAFITTPILNPSTISYKFVARTLCINHLYFIKYKGMILALLDISVRQIIWPIQDNKFLLFANNESIKTSTYIVFWLSLI